jgi:Tol biopolymer transport system component
VAALILGLLAALLLYAGSHQQKLPPPFGPAKNGILLSSGDLNIVVVDPTTLSRKTLISNGFGPGFSPDGTKLFFLRPGPSDCGQADCGLSLMVADIDGSNVRALTPKPVSSLDWAAWSPDGSKIAFLEADTVRGFGRVLAIANADGSGVRVDPAHRHVYPAGWLPPNGDEIVVRLDHLGPGDPMVGIWAVRSDGTRRPLTTRPAHSENDYQQVAVSPDGQLIAYRDDGEAGQFQIHVLDLRTQKDWTLLGPKGQWGPSFSPDGTKIAYVQNVDGDLFQLAVAPVDGSAEGTLLGKAVPIGSDGPSVNNYSWTPDGTGILANYELERIARLVPIDGSKLIDIDRGDVALPTMQRLAP